MKAPDDRVGARTRIELSGRDTKAVIAAARQWIQELERDTAIRDGSTIFWKPCGSFKAITWSIRICSAAVLHSPSDKARAAAVRVCAYWQDRLPNVLDLGQAADDASPLVRLMAVWAASYVPRPEAAEIVLRAEEHPERFVFRVSRQGNDAHAGAAGERGSRHHRAIAFKTQAGGCVTCSKT